MAFTIEINSILKLKPEQGLNELEIKEKEIYLFKKEGNRLYKLKWPANLINKDWEAVAKIRILEFTNSDNLTYGKYEVLRIYEGQEKEIITKNVREDASIFKGGVDDFKDLKVS